MRFMELPKLKPGYCWQNIAPLGEKPDWRETVAPCKADQGETLFGYPIAEFMAKQYKGV